jgi:hypothetical protein
MGLSHVHALVDSPRRRARYRSLLLNTRPLAIDLFCGLGGWTEGLMAAGYRVVGFDIERHVYGEHRYPAQLVLQDVLTLHGRQFASADLLVASPPCQAFSCMAMPFSRGKRMAAEYRDGTRDVRELTALFDACFRSQREACEAAGRHIPLVVENVCGAQPWVGRAKWHYGSYYLWGDVPALMPMTHARSKAPRPGNGRQFVAIRPDQFRDDRKVSTMGAGWYPPEHPKHQKGLAFNSHAEHSIKQHGSGRAWFSAEGQICRETSSRSPARRFASAMIAKIPFVLAKHIGEAWYPAAVEFVGAAV